MTTTPQPVARGKKLLDQYCEALGNRHYSPRTEETYISWVRQYILFHNKRHPRDMGAQEINDFITHLVSQRKVSASTQNQALSAILFLYRHVLRLDLDESRLITIRPSKPKRVPTVLSREEAPKCDRTIAWCVQAHDPDPVWERAAPDESTAAADQRPGFR